MRRKIVDILDRLIIWLTAKRNWIARKHYSDELSQQYINDCVKLDAGRDEIAKLWTKYKDRSFLDRAYPGIKAFEVPAEITQLPKVI